MNDIITGSFNAKKKKILKEKPAGAIESISQEKKISLKKNSNKSNNLLPNNSESWKYYQERNGSLLRVIIKSIK